MDAMDSKTSNEADKSSDSDQTNGKPQSPSILQCLKPLLEYPVLMATVLVSGIGGAFQLGFNITVLNSPSAFIKELVNRTCAERYNHSVPHWELTLIWSFIVSIWCLGGAIGGLMVGWLLSKLGRKKCLFFNNFLAIAAALLMILSKTAVSFEMIMAGRFLSGVNAGIATASQSIYVSECTPKRLRGMTGVTISLFVNIGKFTGQVLGLREILGTEDRWPWLLGFTGFVALLQMAILPFLPESPSFLLLHRGDRQACEAALKRLRSNKDCKQEMEEMMKEKAAMDNVRSHSLLEFFRNKSVRWQMITIVIYFLSLQLCGINAVYFYGMEVFGAAGIQDHNLLYAALGMGACAIISTLICVVLIAKMGEKILMVAGFFTMSATLVLLTITLYFQDQASWLSYCSLILVFLYIVAACLGPLGIIPPVPAKILTLSFKSAGFTTGSFLQWMSLFVVAMVFPELVEYLGSFCFLLFLAVCLGTALYVQFNVPETKNKTALEIAAEFEKMHSQKTKAPEPNLSEIVIQPVVFIINETKL